MDQDLRTIQKQKIKKNRVNLSRNTKLSYICIVKEKGKTTTLINTTMRTNSKHKHFSKSSKWFSKRPELGTGKVLRLFSEDLTTL
jgi:hypothetical protein